jgi:hypothetical protein
MQQIYVKYDNLKKFILTVDDKNEWITYLQTVPYESFHITMKSKLANNLTQEQIYEEIIQTSKIEPEKISEIQQKTLKRYIQYFSEISRLF